MPDDNRTQDQSNDTLLDPLDDLIAPILGRDVPADSRRPTAPNALSNIVKADHDALVTDEELLAEARNEMPPSSASKAPTRRRRIWLRRLLVACLWLVATGVLIWERDRERLRTEHAEQDEAARQLRQAALDRHLSKYEDDPVSQTIATIRFRMDEEDAQKATRQKEYDDIVSKHDDPLKQALAVGNYYLKQSDAPEAKRAFADREELEKLKRIDKLSRKLERITPNNAFIREPVGGVLHVATQQVRAMSGGG